MEELKIVVKKQVLMDRLNVNKKRFEKSFKALLTAYEKKVKEYQKQYGEHVKKVAARKMKASESYRDQPSPPPEPVDRTKDYDFYLDMLLRHQGETIEVSEMLYRRLWSDKWDWTSSHYHNMMFYASAGGSGSTEIASMADAYSGE